MSIQRWRLTNPCAKEVQQFYKLLEASDAKVHEGTNVIVL
jgi:hypothetical protein